MNEIREGLDRSGRKIRSLTNLTLSQKRSRLERSLCPSSATLIIVPLALLEHWYEQIKRHLNLYYYTNDKNLKGVVYLDGLGDYINIQTPLSKLNIDSTTKSIGSIQFLSHYLIVITTFERCEQEIKLKQENGNENSTSSNNISLLQMRWLRLLVDEGHELGKVDNNIQTKRIRKFISQIAAERRWVMSGTPTTGAKTELALQQLYNIFQFLRHPYIISTSNNNNHNNDHNTKLLNNNHQNKSNKRIKKESSTSSSITTSTTAAPLSISDRMEDFISMKQWSKLIIEPCLAQRQEGWNEVIKLLKNVLLRHTKVFFLYNILNIVDIIYSIIYTYTSYTYTVPLSLSL